MSLVERVARAIGTADPDQGGQINDSDMGDHFWEKYREHYMPIARAALEATIEHFETLRGDPRLYGQGFNDQYGGVINAINAALKEKSTND